MAPKGDLPTILLRSRSKVRDLVAGDGTDIQGLENGGEAHIGHRWKSGDEWPLRLPAVESALLTGQSNNGVGHPIQSQNDCRLILTRGVADHRGMAGLRHAPDHHDSAGYEAR